MDVNRVLYSTGWALVIGTMVSVADAHLPRGMWLIPELENTESIVIDGVVDDWVEEFGHPVVPANSFLYRIGLHQFDPAGVWFEAAPEDVSVEVWLAWSSSPSRIYGFVLRTDDRYINDFQFFRPRLCCDLPSLPDSIRDHREFFDPDQNDSFKLIVDADHSGGTYAAFAPGEADRNAHILRNQHAQRYSMIADSPEDLVYYGNSIHTDWPTQSPWVEASGVVYEFGSAIEFAITGWDDLDWTTGPSANAPHIFKSGQVIGLQMLVRDFDETGFRVLQPWKVGTLGGESRVASSSHATADVFDDFLLVGTTSSAVRPNSWARIKASLAHRGAP